MTIPEYVMENRWKTVGDNTLICKKHDTYFDPEDEPCWACHLEFDNEEDTYNEEG